MSDLCMHNGPLPGFTQWISSCLQVGAALTKERLSFSGAKLRTQSYHSIDRFRRCDPDNPYENMSMGFNTSDKKMRLPNAVAHR